MWSTSNRFTDRHLTIINSFIFQPVEILNVILLNPCAMTYDNNFNHFCRNMSSDSPRVSHQISRSLSNLSLNNPFENVLRNISTLCGWRRLCRLRAVQHLFFGRRTSSRRSAQFRGFSTSYVVQRSFARQSTFWHNARLRTTTWCDVKMHDGIYEHQNIGRLSHSLEADFVIIV